MNTSTVRERAQRGTELAGRVVFGDRTGLALWLFAVLLLSTWWRVGFFLTDTYAVANGLVNLADGHVAITEMRYSLTLGSQPGLHERGGQVYARNYGQIAASVPVLWALEAASLVASPQLVLAGAWSVGAVALGRQLSVLTDRPSLRGVAVVVAGLAFAGNFAAATTLDPDLLGIVALQATSLAAAGFVGVFSYRLVGVVADRRVAVAAGIGSVLATPVGFWATIPKRHVLVTALVVATVYGFARSRTADGRRAELATVGAYGAAGLIAWIHAFEGFFVVATLFAVDLATGPWDRRRVAVVGGTVFLALLPTLVTNYFVSGNPVEPPRLLPRPDGGVELAPVPEETPEVGGGSGGSSDDSAGGGSGTTGPESGILASMVARIGAVLAPVTSKADYIGGFVLGTIQDGVRVLSDAERLWHIFVRSGEIPGVRYYINDYEAVELTVLESAPLLGALVTLPLAGVRAVRQRRDTMSPARQTDLLVCALALVLTVVYLSRLPLFSQITVRYVLPVFPLCLYGVVRLGPVADAVTARFWTLGVAYAVTVLAGGAALVGLLLALDPALGEAMQFHALVNLGAAVGVAALVAGRYRRPDAVSRRRVAVGLGIAAGLTTVLLGVAALELFRYGPFALDGVAAVADAIPLF